MGVQTNKKYRAGVVTTETIVDGDIYKITEEYTDDTGNVVYVYEYYPPTNKVIREHMKKELESVKKAKYGVKGRKRR